MIRRDQERWPCWSLLAISYEGKSRRRSRSSTKIQLLCKIALGFGRRLKIVFPRDRSRLLSCRKLSCRMLFVVVCVQRGGGRGGAGRQGKVGRMLLSGTFVCFAWVGRGELWRQRVGGIFANNIVVFVDWAPALHGARTNACIPVLMLLMSDFVNKLTIM